MPARSRQLRRTTLLVATAAVPAGSSSVPTGRSRSGCSTPIRHGLPPLRPPGDQVPAGVDHPVRHPPALAPRLRGPLHAPPLDEPAEVDREAGRERHGAAVVVEVHGGDSHGERRGGDVGRPHQREVGVVAEPGELGAEERAEQPAGRAEVAAGLVERRQEQLGDDDRAARVHAAGVAAGVEPAEGALHRAQPLQHRGVLPRRQDEHEVGAHHPIAQDLHLRTLS
ncbi:hypothetical protein GCM10020220_069930 [Nonomuraea rubra]